MSSNYPDEGRSANEDGEEYGDYAELPSRRGGTGYPAHTEARAELRDRETYYEELRFAVHCQSRAIPAPRPALDDWGAGAWTRDVIKENSASGENGASGENWASGGNTSSRESSAFRGNSTSGENGASGHKSADGNNSPSGQDSTEGEGWDDMIARFGDTWT